MSFRRHYISIFLALALLVGAGLNLNAQGPSAKAGSIRAEAGSRQIVLGEPFTFSLRATFPKDNPPVQWPGLPDSVAHFEILEPLRTDSITEQGMLTVTHTYKLTSFDSGHWVLPSVAVRWGKKTVQSDTIGMDVRTVPLQGNDYRDIHEIVEVQGKPFNWKLWIAVGASLILVSLGLWYYLKNRRKPVPVAPAYDSKLSPFDQAMQRLRDIRDSGYMQKGDPRSHFTGMTDALKIFLVRKFSLPVMSETTGEILLRMQDGKLGREPLSVLAACLRLSDAVKFAKYPSDTAEGAKALDDMESVIRALNQQNPQA